MLDENMVEWNKHVDYLNKLEYKDILSDTTKVDKLLSVLDNYNNSLVLDDELLLKVVRNVYPVQHDIFKVDLGFKFIDMLELYNILNSQGVINCLHYDNQKIESGFNIYMDDDEYSRLLFAIDDNDKCIDQFKNDDKIYYHDENTLQRFVPMDILDLKNVLKKVKKDIDNM